MARIRRVPTTTDPGVVHIVSENASETEPASLLAVFVLVEGQLPLVMESASEEL